MTPVRKRRWLEIGWLLPGLWLLGLWSWHQFESRRYQATEARKLEAALRVRAPEHAVPAAGIVEFAAAPGGANAGYSPPPTAEDNTVLGRIDIPRLRITAMVAEGADMTTLGRAVGHVPTTALPGEPGNCALAGHRDSFLRGLGGVHANDIVRIVTPTRTFLYLVEWSKIVDPHQVDVLDSTAHRSLTLVTCYPFAWLGHAPKRFIVRARQVDALLSGGTGAAGGRVQYTRAAVALRSH